MSYCERAAQTEPNSLCGADCLQENREERALLDIYTQQLYLLAMMMAPSWPRKTGINPGENTSRG